MRFLLLGLLLLPAVAFGQTVSPLIELALEFGGDDVVELTYEDGDTQTLTAGQGGTLAGGVLLRPSATSPLSARATAGVKALFNASSNANTRIVRFPVEVVASFRVAPDVEIGAGAVAHVGTKLSGGGFVQDVSFDPAFGATVEAGYSLFSLSYTWMEYTAETGGTVDASSVGLALRYAF